jgi:hypothetical protein
MKLAWLPRALALPVAGLLVVWLVKNSHWVEVEERLPPRGAALADPYYALRKVVAATGTALEIREALEPLPPVDTTLVIDNAAWDLFPERDARLRAWVESGGHLVVIGPMVPPDRLRWIPMSFSRLPRAVVPGVAASRPGSAASAADADDDEDEEEDSADASAMPASTPATAPRRGPITGRIVDYAVPNCAPYDEPDDVEPAYERGRSYLGCVTTAPLRPLHTAPTWELGSDRHAIALRMPVGRGEVTGLAFWLPVTSRDLVLGDNALILAAAFDLRSKRPLWLVESEQREPLPAWLWHHARAPLLLALAAVALALWRLMVRFGPREAALAQARRSMGEQVRGTGEFIASQEPIALHAATRDALEETARARISRYEALDDVGRIDALAAATRFDKAALRDAWRPAPTAPRLRLLAAIATLEQARRALRPATTHRP